jgi:hypothetical protein
MSQYKTIATTPAGAPAVTAAVPPAAHAEPNKKPGEPAKAEHTTEMVKEKIEPGRDIFANPIQDNKVNAETTNGVDPAVLEEEKKAKEEKMRSEIEKLKNKVGPLSPSEVVAKAAIEQAEYDAIVKDPSKDDSKPKRMKRRPRLLRLRKRRKTVESGGQGRGGRGGESGGEGGGESQKKPKKRRCARQRGEGRIRRPASQPAPVPLTTTRKTRRKRSHSPRRRSRPSAYGRCCMERKRSEGASSASCETGSAKGSQCAANARS